MVNIKYIKGTIYNCIKFGTDICVLQYDKIHVALSNKLHKIKYRHGDRAAETFVIFTVVS
jgi:hypothetical protein